MNDLLLLALLLGSPKYGYQLKREAGWMVGHEPLHNNIVYPMLRRFLEEGWVKKKAVPGERGQTRQQYALTADGKRNLIERLSQFSEADASVEAAFHLRVGLFAVLKADAQEAMLETREKRLQRRDQVLDGLEGKMDLGKFGGEVVRHMRKQIEMEQEWVRHLRRMTKATSRG
jgi:DNA-binding PadR family transcriptional regulator